MSKPKLMTSLLYGTGLRLMDGLVLRVMDLDFEKNEIITRHGKGGKDRCSILPESIISPSKPFTPIVVFGNSWQEMGRLKGFIPVK